MSDWLPFIFLCAVALGIVAGAFVAEAIATHRLRVDLLIALMRGGR